MTSSQIVSPQINDYMRYLNDSIRDKNPSRIQMNFEILLSLLKDTGATSENPDYKLRFQTLKENLEKVGAKGQGTEELEECVDELKAIRQSREPNFYAIYSVVERINGELGAVTDDIVKTYYDTTRRIFTLRQIPHSEEAASAFVDGLFRATTLQHLSEITLKLLHFSRARIAGLTKSMRHPSIREISPHKVDKEAQILRAVALGLGPNDTICIDGYTGEVFLGEVEIIEPQHPPSGLDHTRTDTEHYVNTYLEWEKEVSGETP